VANWTIQCYKEGCNSNCPADNATDLTYHHSKRFFLVNSLGLMLNSPYLMLKCLCLMLKITFFTVGKSHWLTPDSILDSHFLWLSEIGRLLQLKGPQLLRLRTALHSDGLLKGYTHLGSEGKHGGMDVFIKQQPMAETWRVFLSLLKLPSRIERFMIYLSSTINLCEYLS